MPGALFPGPHGARPTVIPCPATDLSVRVKNFGDYG
jgi:hypothetical protein